MAGDCGCGDCGGGDLLFVFNAERLTFGEYFVGICDDQHYFPVEQSVEFNDGRVDSGQILYNFIGSDSNYFSTGAANGFGKAW